MVGLERWAVVVHTQNLSTQEGEAGGPWVQGQPWLYSEFEDSLGCIVNLGFAYAS